MKELFVTLLTVNRVCFREEIELMNERTSSSRDTLLSELRDKECQLVDSMMIVSLLQEQIKESPTQDKVNEVLDEIKQKNELTPKVNFLQTGNFPKIV